jgi:4-oxalocrotonate tautomerase
VPLVEVTMVEGRSPEQLRTLISKLTDAVETSVQAPRASIRVVLREVPATHWAAGDVTIAEKKAAADGAPAEGSRP